MSSRYAYCVGTGIPHILINRIGESIYLLFESLTRARPAHFLCMFGYSTAILWPPVFFLLWLSGWQLKPQMRNISPEPKPWSAAEAEAATDITDEGESFLEGDNIGRQSL